MTSQLFGRILVAVDDSPEALAAARVAVDLALVTGARLRFVHVIGDGELTRGLARLGRDGQMATTRAGAAEALLRHVAAEAHRAGVPAEMARLSGAPAALVVEAAQAWHADLVVMGRSDVRGAGRAYVGAVTRAVLEFSEVPVLVVPMAA
jgi:nucleotide-binding universal stress UspA family protein